MELDRHLAQVVGDLVRFAVAGAEVGGAVAAAAVATALIKLISLLSWTLTLSQTTSKCSVCWRTSPPFAKTWALMTAAPMTRRA